MIMAPGRGGWIINQNVKWAVESREFLKTGRFIIV